MTLQADASARKTQLRDAFRFAGLRSGKEGATRQASAFHGDPLPLGMSTNVTPLLPHSNTFTMPQRPK